MKIKLLGIDLAKNVFQLCALNQANKVLFNHTVRRAQFCSTIAKLESAQRPGLHPVPVKSIEQQDIQLLYRLRQRIKLSVARYHSLCW